jgi:hypothetical protein
MVIDGRGRVVAKSASTFDAEVEAHRASVIWEPEMGAHYQTPLAHDGGVRTKTYSLRIIPGPEAGSEDSLIEVVLTHEQVPK